MSYHDEHPFVDGHVAHKWEPADAAARTGMTGLTALHVGGHARQLDDNTFWVLVDHSPVTWRQTDAIVVTDHGDLTGKGDDDHTQYTKADGTRAFTGVQAGITPVADADLATKGYTDSVAQGIEWQDSVLDRDLSAPPGGPTTGDRYIVKPTGTGAWNTHDNEIAEWDGAAWQFTVPTVGMTVAIDDENKNIRWNGSAWVFFGTTIDHGNLAGTGDDDHTQYHNDARGDARYFRETEHLDSSAGAGDAGKPIKLDSNGEVDSSMLPPGNTDENVKADGTDPSTGFLIEKLSSGPLIDLDVVVPAIIAPVALYLLNEDDTGQVPDDALDSQPTPFNLEHFYSTSPLQPVYFSDGNGRGLRWITKIDAGGPHTLITGTKIKTQIDGNTKASMCCVINMDTVSGSGPRFFTIGLSTDNGAFGFMAFESDKLSFSFNDFIKKFTQPVTSGKMVVHIVYDSTLADEDDRLKMYINGNRILYASGPHPGASETIDLSDAGLEMFIGNRDGDIRSPDGDIKYCAIFDGALSETQIIMENSSLQANDDADPTPSLTGKTVKITGQRGADFQDVPSPAAQNTTSGTFVDKTDAVITTPALTGTYLVEAIWRVWNSDFLGESRLWNDTDSVAIGDIEKKKLADSAERHGVHRFGTVVFTGAAKTFKVQFKDTAGVNTQNIDAVRMLFAKVAA